METPSPNSSAARDLPYSIFLFWVVLVFCFFFLTSFSGYYCKLQFWGAVFPYYQDLQRLDISVDEDIHRNNPSIKKT